MAVDYTADIIVFDSGRSGLLLFAVARRCHDKHCVDDTPRQCAGAVSLRCAGASRAQCARQAHRPFCTDGKSLPSCHRLVDVAEVGYIENRAARRSFAVA